MFETVLITFIAMLADVVVSIPMIIIGAYLPRKYVLVIAIAGGFLLSIAMSRGPTDDMFVVELMGRLMAMIFAGLIGTIIYDQRMKRRARHASLNALPTKADASL